MKSMNYHKRLSTYSLIALLALALPCASAMAADPIKLRLASFQPSTSKVHEQFVKWTEKIEKETNGKVEFVIFPGATLAKASDTYDSVANGLADLGWTFTGYSQGRFTVSEVITLPLGFANAYHATEVMYDLYDKYPAIQNEFKDVHLLWLSPGNMRQIHSRVPINKPEDLQGLKVRVPGSEAHNAMALGAVPVSISGPEVYEALERGVIDADWHPWEAVVTYRWYEVAKYHTQADLYGGGLFIFAMNTNVWNRLPADVQQVFTRYSGRATSLEVSAKGMWDTWDTDYKNEVAAMPDNTIIEWSREDKTRAQKLMADAVEPRWLKAASAKGAPAQEILDDAKTLMEKYRK
ncbi:MAG: TRAP transporter substrate-binding protein [Desulfopila sp.]